MEMQEQTQFLIDNFQKMSYRQFADKFGVTEVAIAKRVERLRKKGFLTRDRKVIPGTTDYSKIIPRQ